jgi:S-phase kinase-associated protein 1
MASVDIKILSLDDDEKNVNIVLTSSDSVVFKVDNNIILQSELIRTMLECDNDNNEIFLPNIKGNILSKVIDYFKHHHNNPAAEIERPLKSNNFNEVVSVWDAQFVEVDDEILFDLILAANYMDSKPLLDLACAKVASFMNGKSAEQIRQRFNIKNDLTPEEEEAIKAENKWIDT